MPQPQPQIQQALTALDAAIKAEPEMADVATLKHARSLVQRVFTKNAGEQGTPSPQAQATTYTQAKNLTLKQGA